MFFITILSSILFSACQIGKGAHQYLFLDTFRSGADLSTSRNLFFIHSGVNLIVSKSVMVFCAMFCSLINRLVIALYINAVSHLRQCG